MERTEEETVEQLKQWLRENGMSIVLGIVIGLSGIFGVRYWFNYQQTQAEEASLIYGKVASSLESQNFGEVISSGNQLREKYSGTAYAALASLAIAKASYTIGDSTTARDNLAWIIKNADDAGLKHIARIRLVRLFIDIKDYPAAMALITDNSEGAFNSLYEDLRGDIHIAQNNPDLAREAYRQAIVGTKAPEQREFIQMKLDNITASNNTAPADENKK